MYTVYNGFKREDSRYAKRAVFILTKSMKHIYMYIYVCMFVCMNLCPYKPLYVHSFIHIYMYIYQALYAKRAGAVVLAIVNDVDKIDNIASGFGVDKNVTEVHIYIYIYVYNYV